MVQEKLKGIPGKVKDWWKAATKKMKILLGSVLLAVLIVIGVITAVTLNQPYSVLFTGLNQTEMSEIVSYLSDNGITDYRISGSDTILVPSSQEYQLKADLVLQGYPTSGYAHSTYFENVNSLTTESERTSLMLYDLEDSIEATLRCFDGVSDATVQLTPQEDNTYVLDKSSVLEAKASVMIIMEDGKKLSGTQVTAIRNLVSHAVKGLEIDNVSIVDSYGNSYSGGDGLGNTQDASALKLQLEEQVNNLIRTNIFQILSPLYGDNNFRVSVNSVVDVDRRVTESTNYSTEDWAQDGSTNGEGIVGSQSTDKEVVRGQDDTAGGVAGTETNSDLNTYVDEQLQANGDETLISSSEDKNYLVDQEIQQVEQQGGTIEDVMFSVTINRTTAGNVDVQSLTQHIARAAGISPDVQDDKISIVVEPFYEEPGTSPIPLPDGASRQWILIAAAGGLVLFLLVLTLILVISHKRRKRREAAAAQEFLAPNVPLPEVQNGPDISELRTEKSMQLRKDVRKFAENNPEIAAQMVKNWLKEGDE